MTTSRSFTKDESDRITTQLQKPLGPEFLTQRPGPTGRLTYIEGKTAINLANEIFGFNGWSSNIKDTTIDFVDVLETGRINLGVSVTVRITLKDGTYHEDIGYGSSENTKSKAIAFEKARKQAVTDATKRALRNFGNALGNCIYDKVYLNGIGRMANPQIKFLPGNLYRHQQFDTSNKSTTPQQQQQPTDNAFESKIKIERILPPSLTDSGNARVSTSMHHHQPLIPEDGFSYEGEDDIFEQDFNEADLRALEDGMSIEQRLDPIPLSSSSATKINSSTLTNEDNDNNNSSKKRSQTSSDSQNDSNNKKTKA
ncbi:hypothetical protein G6F57_002557 [Rhizopus arrhizus]|nr:hypothetical protein G6F23_009424 [Rhizopus arrhizus]KAG0761028.1 hypothetical protein G6F24_007866 [Rhizopus arrhizus]KAG0811098.1 hypothetical protein G6F20_007430 [Rhizopus arrhizus]KAG0829683.1 hypothetical protein G6F19_007616 [Rhizopus arrhizus]KAG0830340.1 hypothetical protein G6F18_008195 [Rhizopus arrhizus]